MGTRNGKRFFWGGECSVVSPQSHLCWTHGALVSCRQFLEVLAGSLSITASTLDNFQLKDLQSTTFLSPKICTSKFYIAQKILPQLPQRNCLKARKTFEFSLFENNTSGMVLGRVKLPHLRVTQHEAPVHIFGFH